MFIHMFSNKIVQRYVYVNISKKNLKNELSFAIGASSQSISARLNIVRTIFKEQTADI